MSFMYIEYQCARVNGSDWADFKARFSSELINLYKTMKLYRYHVEFLKMFELPEYAPLVDQFPRYKPHTILVQYATCKDGSLPGPDNPVAMLGKRRRFAFDLSNADWWDRLNEELATDAGAPGARVIITVNNRQITGPEQVGLLYQAKAYEIIVQVDPKKAADTYKPRPKAHIAEVRATRIQSDLTSASRPQTKGIMALMNDPTLLTSDETKKAIESNMSARGARKSKRVNYAKTDIVKQPAEYKYLAKPMSGDKWSHSESAKFLAHQLAGAIAGHHVSKKKKKKISAHLVRKPSHGMRRAIRQELQNPANFGTQIKPGESVDDMLRRRGVKDIAGAYAATTDAICQRVSTANRNYLPRTAAKTEDPEVIKDHASKAYKKVLIGAGFGDWIERMFGDGECNDMGPSAPIWPGAVIRTPEEATRFAMNYRHCCPDDHRVCLPEAYQHSVAMQCACPCGCALSHNCNCRCPSPNVCACAPCRTAPNVVVIRTDYFSDSSDCESREHYDCEYSSSSSSCGGSDNEAAVPKAAAIPPPIVTEPEVAPKLVHTRDCNHTNFVELFSVAHKHVYSKAKQVLVFAPCNDTFTAKTLKKYTSRVYASEEERVNAYVEICNQYVVRQIPQNFCNKVTIQSLSKRVYSIDLANRRILNIDAERAKRFVDDHHYSLHEYKAPYANTILVPVHIKYKDVPVAY